MRFSIIRTGLAALAAAVAFAACGGQSMVPSQNFAPGGSFLPDLHPHTSPCAAKTLPWYFHGSCVATTLTSKGNSVKLAPYKGVSILIKLGANTAKGTVAFIVGDATGVKDITAGTVKTPFPLYSTKQCTPNNNCQGTSLMYIEAANNSKAVISLSGSSQIVVTAAKFPGKGCFPALLTPKKKWTPEVILTTAPKAGKVTINIPGGGLFTLPAGAAYIDMVCK